MKHNLFASLTLAVLATLNVELSPLRAQGTTFTYQGRLTEGGGPAQGIYDLRFTIYDDGTNGSAVTAALDRNDAVITNGLFTEALDFGAGIFTGADRWLEIAARPGASAGAYTSLVPRQAITAAPYAITAGNLSGALPSASLSGAYANVLTMTNAANRFGGNGSNLTALNATQLAGGTVPAAALSNAWRIGGNAAATPGTHFLGTTDTNALELKVNNQRGLRLEPTTNTDAVNVIGGSGRNFVGAGAVGATIGGGGAGDYIFGAGTNRVEADFGTVSGGNQNAIQTNAAYATIAGGNQNAILPNAASTTIGGGAGNTIQSDNFGAAIAGGVANSIQPSARYAAIGGGYFNTIQSNSFSAAIGGGYYNTIQTAAGYATVGGGDFNTIQTNAVYATIPGGLQNSATDYAFAAGRRAKANHTGAFVWADATDTNFASTGSNQFLIRATGNVGINKTNPATALDVNGTVTATGFNGAAGTPLLLGTTDYQPLELKVNGTRGLRLEPSGFTDTVTVIGGSARNFVGAGAVGATIGGGGSGNYGGVAYTNRVEAPFGTVSGGAQNTIDPQAEFATIGGGCFNTIQTLASMATVAGGRENTIQPQAELAVIGGGYFNRIQSNSLSAIIGGGYFNTIEPKATYGAIGGGYFNRIQPNALCATIPGGEQNSATNYAFAAGRRAKANHTGAFVWADSTNADFPSTANNQFLIRAAGNVGINNNNPVTALEVNGTVTATGFSGNGAGLTSLSAANLTSGTLADARLTPNVALRSGDNAFTGNQTIAGSVVVDQANQNTGAVYSASLTFGSPSGEGIASKRTPGANQWGLDFYSGFQPRMTIANNGDVGIGTLTPGAKLDVAGSSIRLLGPGGAGTKVALDLATYNPGANEPAARIVATDDATWGANLDFMTKAAGASGNPLVSRLHITSLTGNVGIGTTTPGSELHVNGTVTATRFIGGSQNSADGTFATVGGGAQNNASGAGATVGGGNNNISLGLAATVPGGDHNLANGDYSFAAGRRAKANQPGAFVWADATDADIGSTNANSVTLRASGGYRLFSNSGATAGVFLAAGNTSWATISDRNVKKDFAPVDQRAILEKLAALPITQWHYQWESPDVTPHLGPMAQDFKAAFYPGADAKSITTQEADGVALAAIQGLNEKVENGKQKAEIRMERLEAENAELRQRLEKLERLMSRENGGAK